MSTNATTNSSSTESESENDHEWEVAAGNFILRKTYSYGKYELEYGPYAVEFEEVRSNDDGTWDLRDNSRNTLGTFDPHSDGVPEKIETAWSILVGEM